MRPALLGLVAVVVLAGCSGGELIGPAPTDPPQTIPVTIVDEPEANEDAGAVAGGATPLPLPSKFNGPSKRTWAKIVKSPDKYTGKGLKLWACIFQFDAATGENAFLGNASYKKQKYWSLNGENAAFTGDAGRLSDFVEGDIVSMNVVIVGSYSYDTQIGGNTTVPSFQVVTIKRQKGDCS